MTDICQTIIRSGAKKGTVCGKSRCGVHHKEFRAVPKIRLSIEEEDLPEHKNHILVFDTETTGLIKENAPRLIQIAWRKFNSSYELLSEQCILIYPDQFLIPAEAIAVHHLTQEYCEQYGIPIEECFAILTQELQTVGRLVAHNIDYDDMVVSKELERANHPLLAEWTKLQRTCTMRLARTIKFSPVFLKLAVLYEKCFNKQAEGELHQADTDTRLCAEIYFYLVSLDKLAAPLVPPPILIPV
jgi:DNA polymerase III epsilon subunit-like protein